MQAWIRQLEIRLTSKLTNQVYVFGPKPGQEELSISVSGHKYMSTLADECTIQITNLTPAETVRLIRDKFYSVEVWFGYKGSAKKRLFKGSVLYISNRVDDVRSNTIIILCGSELRGRYSQKLLNLSINSGINMYSALTYICKMAGIPNSNVSQQFKKEISEEFIKAKSSAASTLQSMADENSTWIVNADSSEGSVVTIFNAALSNNRVLPLDSRHIILQTFPQLHEDGLELLLMPTYSFMCGDVIKIDKDLITLPVQNASEITKNYGYQIDEDGYYMIYQMDYTLQNRGSQCYLKLLCKSRSLISNISGV